MNLEGKKTIKKLLGVVFILVGLLIIVLPSYRHYRSDMIEQELEQSYYESMTTIEVIEEETKTDNLLLEPRKSEEVDSGIASSKLEIQEKKQKKQIESLYHVEGILSIPIIDLEMPVIEDATSGHLDISISSINDTGKPWTEGNYVIAGHRSRSYGRHFNRLNEIVIGNKIYFSTKDNVEYTYQVTSVQIVDETATWVMRSKEFKEITLITCDPINIKNPPTRLIVKGQLIN